MMKCGVRISVFVFLHYASKKGYVLNASMLLMFFLLLREERGSCAEDQLEASHASPSTPQSSK